jgi:hypothetical protein
MDDAQRNSLPSVPAMTRALQRFKRKSHLPVAVPADRVSIHFTPEMQMCNNEHFVLHDDGPNEPDRMIIFGAARNLRCLRNWGKWFAFLETFVPT